MEKAQFSETQFVIGYTRELVPTFKWPFTIYCPSTRDEKKWASDFIVKKMNNSGRFLHTEFYQFKRSKYYNSEIFDSLKGGTYLDTGATPMYGFNIYNTKATRQFNVLQKLAVKPRCKVYYCAPLFHKINEFNIFFSANSILQNSKVFPLSQSVFQNIRIPLGSNHQVIFSDKSQFVCSDPIAIEGFIASDRESSVNLEDSNIRFEDFVFDLYNFVTTEISSNQLNQGFEKPPINLFEVREMLINYFDIYWTINNLL